MTAARDIAKKLREVMNREKWTASDVQRGLVVLLNGRLQTAKTVIQLEPQTCKS